MDPTTQTAIASVFTAIIATSGVIAVAVINNNKERSKAADAGVEAGLSDREVLQLVGELTAENARKEFTIQNLKDKIRRLEDENEDLKEKLAAKGDT